MQASDLPSMAPILTAPITSANPSVKEMLANVARFDGLQATNDYIDANIPGCERTTLRIIGDPPQAPIPAEHFHMNLVCCEPGKQAPLHNHLTQEVFMALSGEWEVFWGPSGERSIRLKQWDTISIPPGVSRGFRNVGRQAAYLLGIAGSKNPGMINWPQGVRQVALAAGVSLP